MSVQIRLLGGFAVCREQVPVPADAWVRRQAAHLVQVLALSRDHRMHREQVVDALWPGLSWELAGPRLHKAAHFARRALDDPDAVVLRNELVALFPHDGDVQVDLHEFTRAASEALRSGDPGPAAEALARYAGPLLPEDRFEPWTEEPRRAARMKHLDLLRLLGRWQEVLEEEPADEQAHLALARAHAERGDPRAALVQLERLEQGLRHELGASPGPEAVRLRAELDQAAPGRRPAPSTSGNGSSPTQRLYGRRDVGERIRAVIDDAAAGRGATVLVSGPAGVGKSVVLDLADSLARRQGWKVGRGGASAVEGSWPYAPVLEALSALCRHHPGLLDALGDDYRLEIERALTGRDLGWTGESRHQRLFVAAAELMRMAAAGPGVLLAVDDLHDADEASLRLLHYLSRCAADERVVLVVAARDPAPARVQDITASMVARRGGVDLGLGPLGTSAAQRLLGDRFPELDPAASEEIAAAAGGLPFAMLEMARARVSGAGSISALLPPHALRTFQRVALLGVTFTTDELLAVSDGSEEEAYAELELALAALVVEPTEAGFRFRHQLVREAMMAQLPQHHRAQAQRRVAEALARLQRPPGRVAHHYLAAGLGSRAVPYVVRAVEIAGALGGYRDALELIDGVREHAGPEHLPVLLARRGDLLMALGDPGVVAAYTEAARVTTGTLHRLVRARLARAAAIGLGDMETAQSALAGLELEGDEADASLLLSQGMVAYFSGDMDTAWTVANEARDRLQGFDDPWQLVDLVALQGLLTHHRGEWFANFRTELRRVQGHERLARAVFDAHLCVAQNLLYGHEPYSEIIAEAEQLRSRASQVGALRGVAFATALIGEASLMQGDLERAETELVEAAALHADVDSLGGQAHSLQRLAEVRLAQGRADEARRLLDEALPLARWSTVSKHLLQRVLGTMIAAAPDAESARGMVDRAEGIMGQPDQCNFCAVMLAVPAAIACARVGDIDDAYRFLAKASRSVSMWGESSWNAAVVEAEATVALAEGDAERYRRLNSEAAAAYSVVGHDQDAARCLAAASAG